jgi:hypothetical protein
MFDTSGRGSRLGEKEAGWLRGRNHPASIHSNPELPYGTSGIERLYFAFTAAIMAFATRR